MPSILSESTAVDDREELIARWTHNPVAAPPRPDGEASRWKVQDTPNGSYGDMKTRHREAMIRLRSSVYEWCRLTQFDAAGGQRQFLDNVERLTLDHALGPKKMGVKAGTGVGKTAALTNATGWRVFRWPGSFGVATAPSERQCKEVFFAELARWIAKSPLLSELIECNRGFAHVKGRRNWQIYGATARDENAVRGSHHAHLTIAAEELTGIEPKILDAFLRTLSEQDNMFMGIFNPDLAAGLPLEMFTTKKRDWPWNLTIDKLQISRERPDLISPARIEEWRREHGEDSDFWQIGVLGNFPTTGTKQAIPSGIYQASKTAPPAIAIASSKPTKVISHDPARFGGDENVLVARCGNCIMELWASMCEPNEAAREAFQMADRLGWDPMEVLFVVDSVGIGQGVLETYYSRTSMVYEFRSNGTSPRDGYKDELSSAYWHLRTLLRNEPVHIPDDELLEMQITSRLYTYRGGEIKIEPKDEYIARAGKSPDRADALVMAFSVDYGLGLRVIDVDGEPSPSPTPYRPHPDDVREEITDTILRGLENKP